jgi:hypothetical protein
MHYYSIQGSFEDKAGDNLLRAEIKGLDATAGLYDYLKVFQQLFTMKSNWLLLKYWDITH